MSLTGTHSVNQVLATVPELMGIARLMRQAFAGDSLESLAQTLLQRAEDDPLDANALMDLSVVLQLQGHKELGLKVQALALNTQRLFTLPASKPCRLRLLALMVAGDLMSNAPLPFLLENSDIELQMLYLMPGKPLPAVLPAHDVACVAISVTEASIGLLEQLSLHITRWDTPVLLSPQAILRTQRDLAHDLLQSIPGVVIPPTVRALRAQLQAICAQPTRHWPVLAHAGLPWVVRPLDSHAGHGLEKIATVDALACYLKANHDAEFFVSPFVNYQNADGLYRKYRVVLVDGKAYAGHMAISEHWMIHYLNAGMSQSAIKRAEEEKFMRDFDTAFARRHAKALQTIAQRIGLEYLVLDCAETAQGDLLVFEIDPDAVVHAMDPPALFPYKPAAMQKVFTAFRTLLERAAQRRPSNAFAAEIWVQPKPASYAHSHA